MLKLPLRKGKWMRVVAIDGRMLESSGIGTYLTNLLENFAAIENEFVFEVICPRKELLVRILPDRFRYVPGKSPICSVREQWEIARLPEYAALMRDRLRHYAFRTRRAPRRNFLQFGLLSHCNRHIRRSQFASGAAVGQ